MPLRAVDFDGTLAHYDGYKGPTALGKPIAKMVEKVKRWIREGEVVIFTARASNSRSVTAIKAWCRENLGRELAVTNVLSPRFEFIYNDRARQVRRNTGEIVGED